MTPAQPTFSDLVASSGRVMRRRRFLALLDLKIPWGAWAARVEPHDPQAGGGHPPVPLGTMLRMYVVQVAFRPSDEGTEDALWDSASVRSFAGCGDAVPDATTLCRFRSLLAANGLGGPPARRAQRLPRGRGPAHERGHHRGRDVRGGALEHEERPQTARPGGPSGQEGPEWHFGFKAHVGVDAVAGTARTLEVTAANAHGLARAASLVRPGNADVWADSGYTGVSKWVEASATPFSLNVLGDMGVVAGGFALRLLIILAAAPVAFV